MLLVRSFYTDAFTHRSFYAQKLVHTYRGFYTEKSLHRAALRHRSFTHRGFYTEKSLYRLAFTCRSFYTENFNTQKLLHGEVFTPRRFCTQTCLHRGAFTQQLLHREVITQRAFTHKRICTQKCLVFTQRRGAFTHKGIYTEKPLHTDSDAVTQRSLYTESFNRQARLQTETFTQVKKSLQRELVHTEAFTHRSFYTEKPLHPGAFGKKPSPLAPRKKRSSMIPWICSKELKQQVLIQ